MYVSNWTQTVSLFLFCSHVVLRQEWPIQNPEKALVWLSAKHVISALANPPPPPPPNNFRIILVQYVTEHRNTLWTK